MFDRLEAYRIMLLSRCFEQKVHSLFSRGELYGTTHLNIGQEASHTGLCLALGDEDWIVPTHRCHGFNVARGSSISAMFSELYGSRHGLCRGIGGSMHMTDLKTRNFGSSAVVGSSVALATGIAYALSRQGKKAIAAAILGDGATSRGVVHESMNLASVWSLPVLFFCENNHYGMSASAQRMISTSDIAGRASCYGIRAFHADGNVLDDVYAAVSEARRYILENNEPAFIEVDTYRQCGHSKSDKCVYRSEEEEKALLNRLNRIEGQIRGIKNMVEDERYCIDILNQVSAVQAALNSFNRILLTDHIHTCVVERVEKGDTEVIDELCRALQKLMK